MLQRDVSEIEPWPNHKSEWICSRVNRSESDQQFEVYRKDFALEVVLQCNCDPEVLIARELTAYAINRQYACLCIKSTKLSW